MPQNHTAAIAAELNIDISHVAAVAQLLSEGATIPFISRYRKEATGSMDEVTVTAIRDRIKRLEELAQRKQTILQSLERNNHLTDTLQAKIEAASTLSVLEDLYLPFRPKRRTRATMARERGLQPLAELILAQNGMDVEACAKDFVQPEKEVHTVSDALSGARDIIAEQISENADTRARLRDLFLSRGELISTVAKGKEADAAKFRDYFDWREPLATAPSHRILAMRRGEQNDLLNLTIAPPAEEALSILHQRFVEGDGDDARQVLQAADDSYKRLLSRSMETEARLTAKEKADAAAIAIFSENLRQLLLAPPMGPKKVMALDPGFRTGCKLVCLDRHGQLLHHETVYPHLGEKQSAKASQTIVRLCQEHDIEAIAVGNGTAGRETETFLRSLKITPVPIIVMVNESGASIYSASEVARKEFPDLDLTVRGAISIGRRLMDPLAELVKIDAKSIGVGQYQHDVDQSALKEALDEVVVSCVNQVGVDVNMASEQLLTYVSGLGPRLAANIVAFRYENGPFASRKALKKVPRLGPKAFEQSAGFMRIANAANPLDASAVHPESYPVVEKMAADLGLNVQQLMADSQLREKIRPQRYVSDQVGLPTLQDIVAELAKPGRDPRAHFETVSFAKDIHQLEDLKPGMKLPGVITNITAFGAFVDVGVHQDGLVHISQLADGFVKDPTDVVHLQQPVQVTVLDVDLQRRRISLSMRRQTEPNVGTKKSPRASKAPLSGQKAGAKRKPQEKKQRPFHNPFAEALKKRS